MTVLLSSEEVLQRDYLDMRAKIIELAASIDRIDRACGRSKQTALSELSAASRSRLDTLGKAIAVLSETDSTDRAERIQMMFSIAYESSWRKSKA